MTVQEGQPVERLLLVRPQLGLHGRRHVLRHRGGAITGERGQRADRLAPAIRLLDHVGEILDVAPEAGGVAVQAQPSGPVLQPAGFLDQLPQTVEDRQVGPQIAAVLQHQVVLVPGQSREQRRERHVSTLDADADGEIEPVRIVGLVHADRDHRRVFDLSVGGQFDCLDDHVVGRLQPREQILGEPDSCRTGHLRLFLKLKSASQCLLNPPEHRGLRLRVPRCLHGQVQRITGAAVRPRPAQLERAGLRRDDRQHQPRRRRFGKRHAAVEAAQVHAAPQCRIG